MKAKQRAISAQKPNAWICNLQDRGRKSIKKDNKIYLEDGQEFLIELHNPLKESVLAEIKINRKSISKTGLILRPGERFYLDCFIDDKKKFIFKTYEVENNNESKEAISNNGIVEVFFYKEETITLDNWREKFKPVIEKHYHHYYPWYRPYWYYYGGTGTITISNPVNFNTSSITTSNAVINGNSTITAIYSSNSSYTIDGSSYFSNTSGLNSNLIETGRIEKGSDSSQKFEEAFMDFEKLHIASIVYQLLPKSQKPVETKDIRPKESVNKDSIIELIKKLSDLHSAGILTQDEFNLKKKELLDKI